MDAALTHRVRVGGPALLVVVVVVGPAELVRRSVLVQALAVGGGAGEIAAQTSAAIKVRGADNQLIWPNATRTHFHLPELPPESSPAYLHRNKQTQRSAGSRLDAVNVCSVS